MKFQNDFILPSLTPQTAILGLYNEANDNYNPLSHIFLIFKYCIYILKEKQTLNIDIPIANLIKVEGKAKISIITINKREAYKKGVHYRQHFNSNLIMHCENHTGWVGRGFVVRFICLYAFFIICLYDFLYVFVYFSYYS